MTRAASDRSHRFRSFASTDHVYYAARTRWHQGVCMVRRRQRERSLFEVLLPDGHKLWPDWLRRIDTVLEDEAVLEVVAQALEARWPESRRRGRPGTPAEVVIRSSGCPLPLWAAALPIARTPSRRWCCAAPESFGARRGSVSEAKYRSESMCGNYPVVDPRRPKFTGG